ncbi:MAG: tRNA pseudouridine(38-40) synthase TruA [Alkalispirochaeta sp.]
MIRTILIRLAYDGTAFAGYQRQRTDRTVQQVLETALSDLHGHPVITHAAGRTDSGVHATGQYVSFESDRDSIAFASFPPAINSRLPHDVRVTDAREVPLGFHARFDARRRHYRYRLVVGAWALPHRRAYAWRIPEMPDVERLNADTAAIVGTHDFTTFAARRKEQGSMVRTVHYAHWSARGDELEFAIGADGFLWHMVRSIVGTLVERERRRLHGEEPIETVRELLERRDRGSSGTTAPAWGLYLHDVEYEG